MVPIRHKAINSPPSKKTTKNRTPLFLLFTSARSGSAKRCYKKCHLQCTVQRVCLLHWSIRLLDRRPPLMKGSQDNSGAERCWSSRHSGVFSPPPPEMWKEMEGLQWSGWWGRLHNHVVTYMQKKKHASWVLTSFEWTSDALSKLMETTRTLQQC